MVRIRFKQGAMVNSGKRPTIAIVLPDLSGGGAERLHILLANYWHALGVSVHFVLMSRRGELIELLDDGIGCFDLGATRVRQVVLPLVGYLRKERPDIVVAAMWPLTSVAVLSWILAGKPGRIFLSDHVNLSVCSAHERKISIGFMRAVIRLTYPAASGLIAVSKGVKEDMCQLGGFDDSQVRVIYNPAATGVSGQPLPPAQRQQLWGDNFTYHVLSVGSLKDQKDQATLIQAFALVSQSLRAKLTILGEGSLRPELEALVQSLGLQGKVSMPGFVVDPYPWYRTADLFVLSSKYEGFGNVIVEALECGVPVVSTDCRSGPAEILENGRFGLLVPVQDIHALAAGITKCHTKPVDREMLVKRAQDFTVSKIADEYLAYFGMRETN